MNSFWSFEFLWVSLDSFGFLQVLLGSLVDLWVTLDSFGRIKQESLGLFIVPYSFLGSRVPCSLVYLKGLQDSLRNFSGVLRVSGASVLFQIAQHYHCLALTLLSIGIAQHFLACFNCYFLFLVLLSIIQLSMCKFEILSLRSLQTELYFHSCF